MKNRRWFMLGLLLFITCSAISVVGQSDPRIAGIKRLKQTVDQRIAAGEENQDSATLFLIELVVNKNDLPYPAVGIYKSVIKFYYTFGDREKNPYPDRLVKIVIATDRSDRKEASEYLFNDRGQLVLFFEKTEDVEHVLYLARERPIGFEEAGKFLTLNSRKVATTHAWVQKEKANLVTIFRGSIQF